MWTFTVDWINTGTCGTRSRWFSYLCWTGKGRGSEWCIVGSNWLVSSIWPMIRIVMEALIASVCRGDGSCMVLLILLLLVMCLQCLLRLLIHSMLLLLISHPVTHARFSDTRVAHLQHWTKQFDMSPSANIMTFKGLTHLTFDLDTHCGELRSAHMTFDTDPWPLDFPFRLFGCWIMNFFPHDFLSPPVPTTRWTHMHRFLSVCPSVRH